jgi:hypothetical protein
MMEKVADANAPLTMAQMLSVFQKMQETQNEQFLKALATVVTEIRKPPFDPVKEAQKKREAETKVRGEAEYWKKKADRKKNCAHTRQNGTSNIAWARQSDNVERGVCPYCNSDFTPDDGELYEQLRRMPRGMIESVRYVA